MEIYVIDFDIDEVGRREHFHRLSHNSLLLCAPQKTS